MCHHFVKPGVKDRLSLVTAQLAKQLGAFDISGKGVGVGGGVGLRRDPQIIGSMYLAFFFLLGEILLPVLFYYFQ